MSRIVEIWEPLYLENEKTQYMVSDDGRIKNSNNLIRKTHINRYGYEQIHLRHNKKDYTKRVHRLVAETFIPNPENKPTVNHIEKGFKSRRKNNVENLEWATQQEQVLDCIDKNTFIGAKSGEDNMSAHHTNEQIRHVCTLLEDNNLTVDEISEITNVTKNTIYKIVSKKIWTSISANYNIDQYTVNRPYSNKLKDDILQLYLDGFSFKKICKKLNLTPDNKTRCLYYQIKKKYKEGSSTTIENEEDNYYNIIINL